MSIQQYLIISLFVLPAFTVASNLLCKKNYYNQLIQVISSTLWLILTLILFVILKEPIKIAFGNWLQPYGIAIYVNSINSFMLLIFAITSWSISVYSLTDPDVATQYRGYSCGFWMLLLGVLGAITTIDLFNLYVWFELMLVSAFILICCVNQLEVKSLLSYTIINIIGTLLILVAIAYIYGLTGVLSYSGIAHYISTSYEPSDIIFFGLLLFGIAIKSALFPLYFWLPSAYPKCSNSSTMLLSSLVTKSIMLVLLQLTAIWFSLSMHFLLVTMIVIACLTMTLGVFGAAKQTKIRDILSFHIISQIGYILLGISMATKFSYIAALFFLTHNVFVKTALFMLAGKLEEIYNTPEIKQFGDIIKVYPLLSICFFISAMSLAGFPPLSGFWAKFLILKSAFLSGHFISGSIAIFVSLFTLYSMLKIWRFGFSETNESAQNTVKSKLPISYWVALLPLVILPITMGITPDFWLSTFEKVNEVLV